MVKGDDKNSKGSVQKYRQDYCSVYGTFDEPKCKWPSVVVVSMVSPHGGQGTLSTFEVYVEMSEQKVS